MTKRTKNNTGLIIRREYKPMFDRLNDSEKGKLLTTLMEYQWDGVIPDENSGKLFGTFLAMQPFIDENNEKYAAKCETNRRSAISRHENERNSQQT